MAKERGEMDQARIGVDAGSVPPKSRPYGEGMTKTVQSWWRDSRRWFEAVGDEMVERLRDSAGIDRTPGVKGEQRILRQETSKASISPVKILGETPSNVGTERN